MPNHPEPQRPDNHEIDTSALGRLAEKAKADGPRSINHISKSSRQAAMILLILFGSIWAIVKIVSCVAR